MLVIFDCNIWVTLALNGQLDYINDFSKRENVIVSCIELRNETTSVFYRPKLNKYISQPDIVKAIELHDLITTNYKAGKLIRITSDPKDDYLFALSSKSKANYLVTGDKLVLNVARYKDTEIITLVRFKELFNL